MNIADYKGNGNQGLLKAIKEYVNPETYDGNNGYLCLMGQVLTRLPLHFCDLDGLAAWFGADYRKIQTIYDETQTDQYESDYDAAIAMAEEVLTA